MDPNTKTLFFFVVFFIDLFFPSILLVYAREIGMITTSLFYSSKIHLLVLKFRFMYDFVNLIRKQATNRYLHTNKKQKKDQRNGAN